MGEFDHSPLDVTLRELQEFRLRVEPGKVMTPEDCEPILAMVTALQQVSERLSAKNASIARLKALLFGLSTERSRKVLDRGKNGGSHSSGDGKDPSRTPSGDHSKKKLHQGHECPTCGWGKLQDLSEPARAMRIVGKPCLAATIWEAARLRCGACGEIFTAPIPAEAKGAKYDETAGSMIAVPRYGNGFANTRLEQHQEDLGVPIATSVQYEIASDVAETVAPVYEELIRQAAQREVLHNDDTTARILSHKTGPPERVAAKKAEQEGIFITSNRSPGAAPDIRQFQDATSGTAGTRVPGVRPACLATTASVT